MASDPSTDPKVAQNPYAAPVTNAVAPAPGALVAAPATGKMPGTVIALLVFQSISMLLSLLGAIANPSKLVGLVIDVLLIVGLVKRTRLAQHAYVVFGVLSIIFTVLGSITILGAAGSKLGGAAVAFAAVILLVAVGLQVVIVALALAKSTKRYFGLACPSCGSNKVTAANFVFSKGKCRSCKAVFEFPR